MYKSENLKNSHEDTCLFELATEKSAVDVL